MEVLTKVVKPRLDDLMKVLLETVEPKTLEDVEHGPFNYVAFGILCQKICRLHAIVKWPGILWQWVVVYRFVTSCCELGEVTDAIPIPLDCENVIGDQVEQNGSRTPKLGPKVNVTLTHFGHPVTGTVQMSVESNTSRQFTRQRSRDSALDKIAHKTTCDQTTLWITQQTVSEEVQSRSTLR